jgi:hypothetical protein
MIGATDGLMDAMPCSMGSKVTALLNAACFLLMGELLKISSGMLFAAFRVIFEKS